MKSAAFNQMIADTLTMPLSTVTDYARRLKEAGLLSTGARGRHAPEMTPLDAARLVLAILTTDSPAQCVERVQRFGSIPYCPDYRSSCAWRETIQPDEFQRLFVGETAEDVLAGMFGAFERLGIDAACGWFLDNVFHLDVYDFEVRVELVKSVSEGGRIVAEHIVPFKGKRMIQGEDGNFRPVEGFSFIKGGKRARRSMTAGGFQEIGIALTLNEERNGK